MSTLAWAVVLLAGQLSAGDSLEAVRFQGNRSFPPGLLKSVVTVRPGQPFAPGRLENDARLLEQFYQFQGFREATVEAASRPGKRHPVVVFAIREGPRARVAGLVIAGNTAFGVDRLLGILPVRAGQQFSGELPVRGALALRQFYLNSGYPFVDVADSVDFSDSLARLTFVIHEGPRCRIGSLRVRGNRTVQLATILRALELKEGELFREGRLHAARSRLYATRLFQRVLYNVSRPDSLSDLAVVRFDVVEQPYRDLLLGIGIEIPPLRLLLSTGWEHANLFNRGHQLETGVEFSPDFAGNYRLSVDATYRIPYLVLTRIDFFTRPFFSREVVDSATYREFGVESGLSRNVLPRLRVGLTNRLRFVADTSNGITNALGVNLQYESMDDLFDPRQGIYLTGVAEVAGGPLLGENDFYRLTGEARGYQSVALGLVLAGRLLAGRVFPYGRTERVPWYEAFELGGRNSLRGYAERSLGPESTEAGDRFGPMVVNANAELRSPYALGWVGLVGFIDGGEVVDTSTGFTADAFEFSAGLGVRVRTPIGPVRFDWGRRLRNAPPGDRGRLYLGLLHAF